MPCTAHLQGEYDIRDVFCGTVVRLGSAGIEQVYEIPLDDSELTRLRAAAEATRELVGRLEAPGGS